MAVSEDEVVRQIHRWLLENGKTNQAAASSVGSLEHESGIMIPREGKDKKLLINFFIQRPELFRMAYRGYKSPHVFAIVAEGKDPLSLFSRDAVPRLTQDERDQYLGGKSKSRSARKSKSKSRTERKSRSRKNRNRRNKTARN